MILASKNSHSAHRKIFVNSSCRNCSQIPCVSDYFSRPISSACSLIVLEVSRAFQVTRIKVECCRNERFDKFDGDVVARVSI